MGRKTNFFLYYKDFLIIVILPLILLPLPLVIRDETNGPKALCGYLLLLMGGYWCTEALPLGVTSLLPVFLIPLFGFVTAKEVCPLYFKEINMMLLGGLVVALAVEKCNLHRRIALNILLIIGVSPRWLMLGFMVPTWFLSMWISNTATSAMMMPIVIEVIYQMETVKLSQLQTMEMVNIGFENEEIVNGEAVRPQPDYPGAPPQEEKYQTYDSIRDENNSGVAVIQLKSNDIMTEREGRRSSYDLAELDMESPGEEEKFELNSKTVSSMSKGLVISIAYAANCGGNGTIIGTAPNLVCKDFADQLWYNKTGAESPINFVSWMGWGFPIAFLNLVIVWLWLQIWFVGPREFFGCGVKRDKTLEKKIKSIVLREKENLGGITIAEVQVAILFLILVLLWFFRKPGFMPGWGDLFKKQNIDFVADAVPAVAIGVLMFAIPSAYGLYPNKGERPSYLMDWDMMTRKFPWSVLLLLGGGFALAEATKTSGLSDWIGSLLAKLDSLPSWVLVLLLTYLVTLLTQFTSNTATTTLMLPIVQSMALKLGMNPLYLMLPITIATQLAFMLPVATPPNAVAFSAGILDVMDMVKAGTILNVLCSFVVLLATHTWGMAIFNLDVFPFPTNNTAPAWLTTTLNPNMSLYT